MQDEIQAEAERLVAAGTYKTVGEALFNLDLGSGNYSCARCHTKGYSYGDPQITGRGAFGPNLTGGSAVRQFPQKSDMVAFINDGSEFGKRYGEQGQGSGRMPAFGAMYLSPLVPHTKIKKPPLMMLPSPMVRIGCLLLRMISIKAKV
jgi:hypothetical protein